KNKFSKNISEKLKSPRTPPLKNKHCQFFVTQNYNQKNKITENDTVGTVCC
ncbi:hypothetical protein M153_136510001, partial [Pseudoloma neurophilia]